MKWILGALLDGYRAFCIHTGDWKPYSHSGDDSCGCCAAAAAVAAAVRLLLLALLLVAADSADCSSAPVYSRAAVSLPTCWLCCSPIGSA